MHTFFRYLRVLHVHMNRILHAYVQFSYVLYIFIYISVVYMHEYNLIVDILSYIYIHIMSYNNYI